jgi:hypothetical protein
MHRAAMKEKLVDDGKREKMRRERGNAIKLNKYKKQFISSQ